MNLTNKNFLITDVHDIFLTILRMFDTFGSVKTYPYTILDLISQFSKSHNVELVNLELKRSFPYINSAIEAMIKSTKQDCNEKIFNLGLNKTIKCFSGNDRKRIGEKTYEDT